MYDHVTFLETYVHAENKLAVSKLLQIRTVPQATGGLGKNHNLKRYPMISHFHLLLESSRLRNTSSFDVAPILQAGISRADHTCPHLQ